MFARVTGGKMPGLDAQLLSSNFLEEWDASNILDPAIFRLENPIPIWKINPDLPIVEPVSRSLRVL